jgi:hypothetical protein
MSALGLCGRGVIALTLFATAAQGAVTGNAEIGGSYVDRQDTVSASPTHDTASIAASSDTVIVRLDTVRPATRGAPVIWLIDDYPITRARLAELRGGPAFSLIRSTSSLLWGNAGIPDGSVTLPPQIRIVHNSAIPYSANNGGLWSGRGTSSRVGAGAAFKMGRLRIVLAPEVTTSENDSFPPRAVNIIPSPAIPAGRSPFSYPWFANGPYSIDMPLRFGNKRRQQLRPGQSSIFADVRGLAFGFSTENEWWGPGIDNALVLSNNAPGFPHLLLRNSRPLGVRGGDVEFRWLVGGLSESPFFDDTPGNNTRSIASAVVVLRPRVVDNLSIGLARSVIGTSTGWRQIPFRWLDVLHVGGHPNDGAPYDSTLSPGGRDQLFSIFARWVLPASGAEVYGEWGRLDFPRNLRDLLVEPNRGQAYTLGLQWTRNAFGSGFLHLRVENTSLEQSLALANKFAGVWYTSRRVLQGFTNQGEVLGAAVGPGSSGQVAEVNYFSEGGFFGVEFGRARYSEDIHQVLPMFDYLRWCSHDVQLQWGVHGGVATRFGTLSIRSVYQDRLNAYFQGGHGCPRSDGMVDIRNNNLTITFSAK